MIAAAALLLSILLFVAIASHVATAASSDRAGRFWFFIAAGALQLPVLFLTLSYVGRLDAAGFLIGQVVLLGCVVGFRRITLRSGAAVQGEGLRRVLRRFNNAGSIAILVAICTLLALSAWHQAITPIAGPDERTYHASRVLYWLQHGSIFPYETHNLRQTTFSFLAELFFAWPLLFVSSEWVGRMVFWFALPATTVGVYLLTREVRLGRRAALAAALIYVSTPTVLNYATSLKPDLWHPLMVLGAAYFALRAFRSASPSSWVAAGLFLALAVAVKTTSLALAPGLVLAPILRGGSVRFIPSRLGLLAIGLAAGLILSGAASLMYWNWRDHGSPMGDERLRQVVQADHSLHQIRVHAARVPLYLLELPELPSLAARQWLEERGSTIATRLGADARLPPERPHGWPGQFQFSVPEVAHRYSLAGVLWVPVLFIAGVRLLRERRKRGLNLRSSRIVALVIIQLPLLVGVIFMLRWIQVGPGRFWMAPYALAIPVIVYFVVLWCRARPLVGAFAVLCLVWMVYPAARHMAVQVDAAARAPVPEAQLNEPYHRILPLIEPGSTILLIAGRNTRDYPLFAPRQGYANRIIPWGGAEFDRDRLSALLEQGVTHIVLDADNWVPVHGHVLRTEPFAAALHEHPGFTELAIQSPRTPRGSMRVFARTVPD